MAETTAERKEVASPATSEVQRREAETVLRPPVDIFEDADGITLVADMPGVSKERLNLQVDNDSLTVEGEASVDMREGMEAVYADVHSTRFRRSFALSGELDSGEIDASLKDGVLKVRIPKRAEMRPRKVDVRTD